MLLNLLLTLVSKRQRSVFNPEKLSDENFKKKISNRNLSIVLFCGKEKEYNKYISKFNAAASLYFHIISFFIVETEKNSKNLHDLNITIFPSILVFNGSTFIYELKNEISSEQIIQLTRRLTENNVTKLDTEQDISKFLKNNFVFIALIMKNKSEIYESLFKNYFIKYNVYLRFLIIDSKLISDKLNLPFEDGIYIRRITDDRTIKEDLDILNNQLNFEKFILNNYNPIFQVADVYNLNRLFSNNKLTLFCACNINKKSSLSSAINRFNIIYNYTGNVINYLYNDYKNYITLFGSFGYPDLDDQECALLNISKTDVKLFHSLRGKVGIEDVLNSIREQLFNYQLISPKSEEPYQNSGNIIRVVGKDFYKVLSSSKYPKLVYMSNVEKQYDASYAIYKESVNNILKKYKNAEFYYIRSDLNDIPELQYHIYLQPCIIFFPPPPAFPAKLIVHKGVENLMNNIKQIMDATESNFRDL